jgi:hypothetical protein
VVQKVRQPAVPFVKKKRFPGCHGQTCMGVTVKLAWVPRSNLHGCHDQTCMGATVKLAWVPRSNLHGCHGQTCLAVQKNCRKYGTVRTVIVKGPAVSPRRRAKNIAERSSLGYASTLLHNRRAFISRSSTRNQAAPFHNRQKLLFNGLTQPKLSGNAVNSH